MIRVFITIINTIGSVRWWWAVPIRSFMLAIKRWREMMTKYYHGEEYGLKYKATGIKWRKCWLLNKLPYWENEKIYIHILI